MMHVKRSPKTGVFDERGPTEKRDPVSAERYGARPALVARAWRRVRPWPGRRRAAA